MKHFRIWWQFPRRYSEQEEERRVTFLELFYDLVYVVIIAELSHSLSSDINLISLLKFTALFVAIWWAWFNGALYHDLHGNNDIKTRVITFLQMMSVASMAVFAHNAIGSGSVGFAISYGFFLLIITYLWWRTGVHDPNHRPLSAPYSLTYLFATLLIIASIFSPPPIRYYLWGIDLFIILLLPLVFQITGRRNSQMRVQIERAATISPSMVERFGLLTIIVLGEVIVGVVQGIAGHHHLTWEIGLSAALGMLIAIAIWWVYFDFVSFHSPKKGLITEASWLYLHLPLQISIASVGAAILNVINHTGTDLPHQAKILLIGAISISLVSVSLLLHTVQSSDAEIKIHRIAGRITFAAAFIVWFLAFLQISTIMFLVTLIAIMLAPVFFGFRIWLKEQIINRS